MVKMQALITLWLLSPSYLWAQITPVPPSKPNLPDEHWPVRDINELPKPFINTAEKAYRVKNPRIVLIDYNLLQQDFSFLREKTEREIDQWVLKHALVAEGQVRVALEQPGLFSDTIPVAGIDTAPTLATLNQGVAAEVVRPKEYNRAIVIPTGENGPSADGKYIIDNKGGGSNKPSLKWKDGDPRNGNTSLGEAIREFNMQKLVEGYLNLSNSGLRTVGIYAVIDPGYNTYYVPEPKPGETPQVSGTMRAGMILRQGQSRFEDPAGPDNANNGNYFLWPEAAATRAEVILRSFGITSVGNNSNGRGPNDVEGGINIQGSVVKTEAGYFPGSRIGDMGNMVVADRFDYSKPVTHFYGERPLMDAPHLQVQPDPTVALPAERYGKPTDQGKLDSKTDYLARYAHETAKAIAKEANPERVKEIAMRHHEQMVGGHLNYLKQQEPRLQQLAARVNAAFPLLQPTSCNGAGVQFSIQHSGYEMAR